MKRRLIEHVRSALSFNTEGYIRYNPLYFMIGGLIENFQKILTTVFQYFHQFIYQLINLNP